MQQQQAPVTRDEFNKLASTVEELKDELESEREKRREVEQERDKLADRIQDLERDTSILETRCDGLADGIDRLEDRLEDGDLAGDVEEGSDPDIPRETPLEDVVALPDDVAERELRANVQRARWFASRVIKTGKKTPVGYHLSAGEIGRLLDVAVEDANPHPETVARIISIIDEMGDDETTRRKKNGEKRIVVEEALAKRLQAHAGMSRE